MSNLTINIEVVENGYILKDLTNRVEGKRPLMKVATDVNSLKNQLSDLIHDRLIDVVKEDVKPPNFDVNNPVFGPVLSNER